MLFAIDKVDRVDEWVKARLDAGKKIMGMGHAVYKTVDPRALILSGISERLAERTGDTKWFELYPPLCSFKNSMVVRAYFRGKIRRSTA